jgi:hypothetical protein
MARRRITYLLRPAIDDLFFGLYSARSVPEDARKPCQINARGHDGTPRVTLAGHHPQGRRFAATLRAARLVRTAQHVFSLDRL